MSAIYGGPMLPQVVNLAVFPLNQAELDLFYECAASGMYNRIEIFGEYFVVENLPPFRQSKRSHIHTEMRVFVRCDEDGNALRDPRKIALSFINKHGYLIK
jgi:hypothetical protein